MPAAGHRLAVQEEILVLGEGDALIHRVNVAAFAMHAIHGSLGRRASVLHLVEPPQLEVPSDRLGRKSTWRWDQWKLR